MTAWPRGGNCSSGSLLPQKRDIFILGSVINTKVGTGIRDERRTVLGITSAATLPAALPAAFGTPRPSGNAPRWGLPLGCAATTSPSQRRGCVCVFLGQALTAAVTGDFPHHFDRETLLLTNCSAGALHAPASAPNIFGASLPGVALLASERELAQAAIVFSRKTGPFFLRRDQL